MEPKPHQLHIPSVGIMTATLGKAELELAAGVLIRVHQLAGDTDWRPVTPREIGERIQDNEEMRKWVSCPFCPPDFRGLIDKGFAEFTEPEGKNVPLMVTPAFVEKMVRWRKPDVA